MIGRNGSSPSKLLRHFVQNGVDNGVLHAQGGTANNGRYAMCAAQFPVSPAVNDFGADVKFAQTITPAQVNYVWDVAGGLPMLLQDGTKTYVVACPEALEGATGYSTRSPA